jgi:hypothetical protein
LSDPVLAAENVRLANELRRTRIQLAQALVVISDLEVIAGPVREDTHPSLPGIYARIQKLWSKLDECI